MSKGGLAALNEMVAGLAALAAIIDEFKILMIVMLIARPLLLLLREPRPA
jgi:DHA2 family multidrug resistance protein